MTFSQYSGTAIVPTLSRIVLCAAFLTAGYNKVWRDATDYTPQQKRVLDQLGVDVEPVSGMIIDAAYQTEVPAQAPAGPQSPDSTVSTQPDQVDAPVVDRSETDTSDVAMPRERTPVAAPLPGVLPEAEVYRARGVHHVTLLLNAHNWPAPDKLAWLAGLTEFFGGTMLAIGFFSRFWAMGLAVAMGVAFYLTTMHNYFDVGPLQVGGGMGMVKGQVAPDGHQLFNTVFSQIGLGVLALGIFLTGPGPLSLDRFIFSRGERSPKSGEIVV